MRNLICIALALLASASAAAQQSARQPGSISGRVTIGGKPTAGVIVTLSANEPVYYGGVPRQQVRTDADGYYVFTGVLPGEYFIEPFAAAHIPEGGANSAGRRQTIHVTEGEAVEGVDFRLVRGGVITGRVADVEGRPLAEQAVNIFRVDESGQRRLEFRRELWNLTTDDRGVYRAFGLPAGRYLVSVGETPAAGRFSIGRPGQSFPHTYHPNATDEGGAGVVEVKEGGEAANIDIVVARMARSFVVTGRIIDADSGKPVAGVQYGHGPLREDGRSVGAFGMTGNRTNAQGEFRLENVAPGRYVAFASREEGDSFYSEPATFEVTDGDVTGVEIKVRRGASISGTAVIEGTTDPEVLDKLTSLEFYVSTLPAEGGTTNEVSMPQVAGGKVRPDGSFTFSGLRPGRIQIEVDSYLGPKGFSLLRVERNGVEQRDIDVAAGEALTGLRLVLGYSTSIVRGQLKDENGELPAGSRVFVLAHRAGGEKGRPVAWTEVDARGRFVMEGLAAGDYVLSVNSIVLSGNAGTRKVTARKQVSVPASGEIDVVLTLDLAAQTENKQQ